jgi:hypothetical protein
LIFCSIDQRTITVLWTSLIFFINRITCQTYVIRGTTLVSIMRSSDVTYKINKNVFKFVM